MSKLQDAWMNDVSAWMSPECLQQYEDLMQRADELDKGKGKGKDTRKDKGANKGSAGKPAKGGKGKEKGSAGKLAGKCHGPWQQAQELKKQCFDKVVNDLAANNAFFMRFVCHPSNLALQDITSLLNELREVMQSPEYKEMLRVSEKQLHEFKQLQRERDNALLLLKRGRHL